MRSDDIVDGRDDDGGDLLRHVLAYDLVDAERRRLPHIRGLPLPRDRELFSRHWELFPRDLRLMRMIPALLLGMPSLALPPLIYFFRGSGTPPPLILRIRRTRHRRPTILPRHPRRR